MSRLLSFIHSGLDPVIWGQKPYFITTNFPRPCKGPDPLPSQVAGTVCVWVAVSNGATRVNKNGKDQLVTWGEARQRLMAGALSNPARGSQGREAWAGRAGGHGRARGSGSGTGKRRGGAARRCDGLSGAGASRAQTRPPPCPALARGHLPRPPAPRRARERAGARPCRGEAERSGVRSAARRTPSPGQGGGRRAALTGRACCCRRSLSARPVPPGGGRGGEGRGHQDAAAPAGRGREETRAEEGAGAAPSITARTGRDADTPPPPSPPARPPAHWGAPPPAALRRSKHRHASALRKIVPPQRQRGAVHPGCLK